MVKWVLHLCPPSFSNKALVKGNLKPLILGTGRVFFIVTIFVTIAASLNKMGLKFVSKWMQNLGKSLPNVIGALIILYIGWKAKEIIEDLVNKSLVKANFLQATMVSKILSWSVFVVSLLVSLEQIGIDMSLIVSIATVLTGVISAGIALTFALGAKANITDILYCYQLHKYFKVGQKIEVNGIQGFIKSIGPLFVIVETSHGQVTIPGNIFNREFATILNEKVKSSD